MQTNPEKSPKQNFATIAFIAILVIGAIAYILPQMFGGNNDTIENDTDNVSVQSVDDGIDLGRAVIAEQADRDGCPVSTTSSLRNVDQFYVIAPDSEVAEGTDIFVRLYRDDIAIEDLPIITADQDYDSTCINFVFETTDGFDFETGNYEAEFWVNGNSYSSVAFTIR
ncbi:MAG: hypothetical protein WBC91_20330 [Phototrophicaceae bacterium]